MTPNPYQQPGPPLERQFIDHVKVQINHIIDALFHQFYNTYLQAKAQAVIEKELKTFHAEANEGAFTAKVAEAMIVDDDNNKDISIEDTVHRLIKEQYEPKLKKNNKTIHELRKEISSLKQNNNKSVKGRSGGPTTSATGNKKAESDDNNRKKAAAKQKQKQKQAAASNKDSNTDRTNNKQQRNKKKANTSKTKSPKGILRPSRK